MIATATRTIRTFTNVDIDIPDDLRSLDDRENPQAGEGCFRILCQDKGDERVVWRSNNIAEINAAQTMFNSLVSKGMVPYKVGTGGRASSRVMDEFDPHAGEVIFMEVAPIVGG